MSVVRKKRQAFHNANAAKTQGVVAEAVIFLATIKEAARYVKIQNTSEKKTGKMYQNNKMSLSLVKIANFAEF